VEIRKEKSENGGSDGESSGESVLSKNVGLKACFYKTDGVMRGYPMG